MATSLIVPIRIVLVILLVHMSIGVTRGENVDLVTLPARDSVQLTIYNSEDLTLAREKRFVTLKKGENQLQFSWAGTLIDPTSVELRPLTHRDEIEIVDTVFPGQKPQHLVWNVRSDVEGQVPVLVSYFTSGLSWTMDYVAIVNQDETEMEFRGYVRVFNNSGEEYENAEIRMIVGRINLVEKIAKLAQERGMAVPEEGAEEYGNMVRDSVVDSIVRSGGFGGFGGGGMGPTKPKEIVKEGLSEYFMFSVDGTETVTDGWSKRMRAVRATDVGFDIIYRMREHQYGPRPVRFLTWNNDDEHKLGESPLPNGLVRVFRENGRSGLSYLGQQNLEYVPVSAEIEVNLGADDLVVYESRITDTRRLNFSFDRPGRRVNGWDQVQARSDRIRNHHEKPIRFELRLTIAGDVEFRSEQSATLFDYQTVESVFDVEAGSERSHEYTVTTHQGANARQNRVRLLDR